MAALIVESVQALHDNYVHLLHDPATGATAAVDPSQAAPVVAALAARGWTLTHVLCTHHHSDHTGGNVALREATGCAVIGARADAARIPAVTDLVDDDARITVGGASARVISIPGHTSGHIAFHFEGDGLLFCGDTLFSLGCGRMFEGTPEQMWSSLCRLRALPGETRVYCGHEYTQANGRFALTVEPHNEALLRRVAEVDKLRAAGRPTVPSLLADERAANPFLRADQPVVRGALGLEGAPDVQVFAELRRRKDVFR